jgi:glycosyltransferase involved in cell wall biosynthesis
MGGLARRLLDAMDARNFDVVYVQREAAILGPPFFEYLVDKVARRPIVYDVDDAIFTQYRGTRARTGHRILAKLLKDPAKADQIAGLATEVIVSSDVISRWAQQFCSRVSVVPTVVDGSVFRPKPQKANAKPVIGWVGTHSTFPLLDMIAPALIRLARKHDFMVRVVGGGEFRLPGVMVRSVPWNIETEVEEFRSFDIGVTPLFDDEWTRAKPGFKQVIYMACGLPQVSSAVGGVVDVLDSESGFLVRSEEEWYSALDLLLSSAELRRRMGQSARARFESGPTLESQIPVLHGVLERAANR